VDDDVSGGAGAAWPPCGESLRWRSVGASCVANGLASPPGAASRDAR
jgi:hypothetical protein